MTGILAARVGLEAKLVDRSSGKEIPLAVQSAKKIKKADVDIYYLEFSLIGIPAGDYDFVVRVEEAGSGLTSELKTTDEGQLMIEGARRLFFVALVLIGPLCLIALSRDESLSLRGRIIGAGMGLESAAVRIDLNGPSTDEERARLYRHWSLADIEGFMAVFLEMRLGTLRFIGGAGSSIPLRAVQWETTASGNRILLVSEYRGSVFGSTRKKAVWTGLFFAIVLDIDAAGKGEGTIHEDAVIDFRRDGVVLVSCRTSTSKKIINVQPAK